jgi:hypothetical protein
MISMFDIVKQHNLYKNMILIFLKFLIIRYIKFKFDFLL